MRSQRTGFLFTDVEGEAQSSNNATILVQVKREQLLWDNEIVYSSVHNSLIDPRLEDSLRVCRWNYP